MKIKYSNFNKGFTLIELIIAIFILSIGIVGIFGAYSAMVVATGDISNKFTATYLAQEGIEIIKDIRNNNPAGTGWNTGLTGCTNGCEADYTTGSTNPSVIAYPMTSWGTNGEYLYTDSNGFYNQSKIGTPTKFKRKITIDISGDEMKVSVTVYWDKKASLVSAGGLADDGGGSVTVEEYLYNWK